jgi:hypothetical protein
MAVSRFGNISSTTQNTGPKAANMPKSAVKTGDSSTPTPPGSTSPTYRARGTATAFNPSTYKIENFSYPIDLQTSQSGENYVVFYINISNDSKLEKNADGEIAQFVNLADVTPRDRGTLVGMNLSQGQAMFASAGEGIIGGGTAGAVLSGKEGGLKGAAVVGGLSALGVAAIGTQTSSFSRQQKRLATAIAMHIPNTFSIRYGANYGDEETKNFAMVAAGGEAIAKAVTSKSIDQLTGPAKSIAAAIALDKAPGSAALSAASGLATNPRKEQVFKNVDFRSFQFDYQFYPRSPEESRNVLNIIKQFKLHMHPEFKDAANFLYIYPSEFDIYYYQGVTENMNVHRHTSCVLTEMSINYAPQGQFTTFDNGMPTQINITLSFRELALMTKEKIMDGF